jgi:hypothetical protein
VDVTQYVVELSTVSGVWVRQQATGNGLYDVWRYTSFTGLTPDTEYFAQVKAVNHRGVETGYENLGSTRTTRRRCPGTSASPPRIRLRSPQAGIRRVPEADSYIYRVSTVDNFLSNVDETVTAGLTEQITGLEVNTTYYGQVAAVINGSTGATPRITPRRLMRTSH